MFNKATYELVKHFEGEHLQAYPDPAHGWSVPTIGYGHTNAMKPPSVKRGDIWTPAQAEAVLKDDLARTWRLMEPYIKVKLNDNQKGALTSFTFNLGIGNFSKSTLLKKLNAGDFTGAANEFDRWVHAGGKKYNGLVRRRAAEKDLFLTPVAAGGTVTQGQGILDIIISIFSSLFRR